MAMAPRLAGRRWRLPLWDGGGAPPPPTHPPSHARFPRRPRLRADKGRPCGPGPFLNCHASRKKPTVKTNAPKPYGADVQCSRSKCRALCAHVLPALHAVLPPQQPRCGAKNPRGGGGLHPLGMGLDAQFQIRNRNKAYEPSCWLFK